MRLISRLGSMELVNLVREEFETRGLESHKRVEQVKKSGEVY